MLNKDTQIALQKGELLPLMEAFYTLQGEGFYKGTAAYFIRLGGCDVGCHWCDVSRRCSHSYRDLRSTPVIRLLGLDMPIA